MRMNLDKGNQPISQVWRWRVDDPASFASEFTTLIKAFTQLGYLSLGQITHGIGQDGESHYVYMTHEDYSGALGWGPKTQAEQQAFLKFQNTEVQIFGKSPFVFTVASLSAATVYRKEGFVTANQNC